MARPRKTGAKVNTRSAKPSASSGGVPDVYKEMLRDAIPASPSLSDAERPLKRRKTRGHAIASEAPPSDFSERGSMAGHTTDGVASEDQDGLARRQSQYDESEVSSESDVDWEEVDLEEDVRMNDGPANAQELNLVIDDMGASKSDSRQQSKRRQATPAERRMKLEIHKLHLLCLLAHVHLRSHWCNDDQVHRSLRSIVSKKTVSYLNPREDMSQFQRTRSLSDGLGQAMDAFNWAFTKTARGMSRSHWAENRDENVENDLPKDLDLPLQKADFRDAARRREGSRDVGAQLFCALLRSVGVDARLTCSLQPLPFHSYGKMKPLQTEASIAMEKYYSEQAKKAQRGFAEDSRSHDQSRDAASKAIGSVGGRSRFASGPASYIPAHSSRDNSSSNKKLAASKAGHHKRIVESMYPIYWVEAFDEATQKWIPVDPLVTKTIGKSRKFEPPMSDYENNMSYVISFEDDGSARDVTKRYTKAYNAKTRKTRVEVTTDGINWLKRAMKMYKRSDRLDRDQVEDAELARKEAQEGLPGNVQDFKDHPYYALERHLRRNETIHPKRAVGNVHAGRAGSEKSVEPIYRRGDVHVVRSADRWYRMGREIMASLIAGEQPLKRVTPYRSQISLREDGGDTQTEGDDDEENAGTSLYAFHQTAEYKPPPVVNGKIPKNVYGNLDLYVPSMVPAGAVHFKHPETQHAARLLGLDYADAVTGFAFKGRHGTAVIEGAVVASEYAEAVREILAGFEDERAQAAEARRSLEALRMWKRLLAGLRIRERIEGYEIEGERNVTYDEAMSQDDARSSEGGGGFLPDSAGEPFAEPTAGRAFYQHPFNDDLDQERDQLAPDVLNHHSIIRSRETRTKDPGAEGAEDYQSADFLLGEDNDAEEALLEVQREPTECHMSGDSEINEGGGFLMDDGDVEAFDSVRRAKPRDAGGTTLPDFAARYPNEDRLQQGSSQRLAEGAYIGLTQEVRPQLSESYLENTELDLANEDLAEATILQQSYESSSSMFVPKARDTEPKHTVPAITRRPKDDGTHDSRIQDPADTLEILVPDESSSVQSTLEVAAKSESSEDETGSLLAEDPSDEDADPEWLA